MCRTYMETLHREFVYINYYFMLQLRQIAFYWIFGMVVGSLVSVFAKDAIHGCFEKLKDKSWGVWGVTLASILGIASPLCMYGTIPIAASFSRQGMRHDWLAAFMMSSVLLNPQLLFYSTALGATAVAVRLVSCAVCGIAAGAVVYLAYGKKPFFDFGGFEPRASRDIDPNPFLRFLKNLGRNIRATAPYFLVGVLLSALFQRYVPLLQQWLASGMSMGSAAAFMITGPATKITNLGALKIVLGIRRFVLYLLFVMVFSLVTGLITNLLV